ncbi:MAG TPA: carboxylesterase family protein [Thermoanaerobaculia bacterium]
MGQRHRIGAAFLSFTLMAGGSLAVRAQKPRCTTATIATSSGPVCGMTSTATISGTGFTASGYLGIPYAVPPVGPRRWQHSTPFDGSAPLVATAYGNTCPQSTVASMAPPSSGSCTGGGKVLGAGQSEDCLYLNVWVPGGATAASRLPVMVFIPGGAFYQGSGGAPVYPPGFGNLYDGTYLAAAGNVIVVTINYRLGALGFLSQGGKDNFGFGDQILALQWVQTNIANFGGNPKNVTLFGESAGGKSVGLHALSSPKSAGLFQAAIMESNALGFPYKNTAQAQALSSAFCSGSPSLCTAATPACDIVEAQEAFMDAQPLSFLSIANLFWAPTVDGTYVTGQPMASAASLRMPLITGTNHDEGVPFVYSALDVAPAGSSPPNSAVYASTLEQLFGAADARRIQSVERYRCTTTCDCTNQLINVMTDFGFTCANRRLATLATQAADPPPLYAYQFDQVSNFNLWAYTPQPVPQCNGLVCHTDELPYVFNSIWLSSCHVAFTSPEQNLARLMGGYWTSFAAGHSPGSAWPPFRPAKSYVLFRETPSTADDPLNAAANCSALWDSIGYETSDMAARLFHAFQTTRRKAP